jgi:DNA-binding response OmpR family regulator
MAIWRVALATKVLTKVLLIDDSVDALELVKASLKPYSVDHALSVSEAMVALDAEDYSLVLIDVGLPDGDGFEVCFNLARDPRYENVPKIMLTGRHQVSDKVYGLNCGAFDYITKPFNLSELKARVDSVLRRQPVASNATQITRLPFELNIEFQKGYLIEAGQKVDLDLTPTEFRLLLAFIRNEGRVLSRKELEQVVWEAQGVSIEARGIDTHISHLRRKLGTYKSLISSIYGLGYSFESTQRAA